MNFGRRQIHAHSYVVQRTGANPTIAGLDRVEDGKKQVAARCASEGSAAVYVHTPLAAVPAGFRRAEYTIDGRFLRARRLVFR